MRIGVISDTHLPGRHRSVPAAVFEVFDGVDAILHAGDLNVRDVLVELEAVAPVHAVRGNNDDRALEALLPARTVLTLGGVTIGMVHDAGATEGRRRRMARAFPGCRVVVFGHSHMPVSDDDGSLLLLNPGSATQPRRAKVPSVAVLTVGGGEPAAEIVHLPAGAQR